MKKGLGPQSFTIRASRRSAFCHVRFVTPAKLSLNSHLTFHLPNAQVHLREADPMCVSRLDTRHRFRSCRTPLVPSPSGPKPQARDRAPSLQHTGRRLAFVLFSISNFKTSEAFQVRDRASFFFPLEFAFAIHGLSAMSLPEAHPPSGTSSLKKTITRGHSCMTCSARKVRCDGQRPCATCTKSAVPCSSKPTQPARAKAANAAKRARDRGNVSSTIEHTPDLDKQQSSVAEHINDQGHSHYVEKCSP
ncbi:hypothetical protein D6C85_05404 [Aureobasidium pullulans]|uniref:Zn(2)-C6 fungal-type domain-containing protein n=1 Tax=Aureobasidium pullulans TaxID=5580 RepID=A0A4S9WYL3_AURPU|nr:hypothetical protein D6C85_05404 [Aureobasidium pullulans]